MGISMGGSRVLERGCRELERGCRELERGCVYICVGSYGGNMGISMWGCRE